MAGAMLTELLNDVEDQAVEQITALLAEVWGSMLGSDGSTYGDSAVAREERIARFVDYTSRGVMDVLAEVSPSTFDKLVSEYLHDVARSPLIAGAA